MTINSERGFIVQSLEGRGAQHPSKSCTHRYSSPKVVPTETILVVKMKFPKFFSARLYIVACHSTCFMWWVQNFVLGWTTACFNSHPRHEAGICHVREIREMHSLIEMTGNCQGIWSFFCNVKEMSGKSDPFH